MKDIAHYAPLLSDSDDGDPVVSPRWPEKRTSIFHLAIIVTQALLIIGLVALNWSTYTKSKSAACSQVVYCKIFIFRIIPDNDENMDLHSSVATPVRVQACLVRQWLSRTGDHISGRTFPRG